MSRVLILVEGRTEQMFIREVLAPALSHQGVYVAATLLGRGIHQGGVGPYQRFRREVVRVLRQRGHDAISTMFDRYRLPCLHADSRPIQWTRRY